MAAPQEEGGLQGAQQEALEMPGQDLVLGREWAGPREMAAVPLPQVGHTQVEGQYPPPEFQRERTLHREAGLGRSPQ